MNHGADVALTETNLGGCVRVTKSQFLLQLMIKWAL